MYTQEGNVYKPEWGPTLEIANAYLRYNLVFDLQPPEPWENKFPLLKSLSLEYFIMVVQADQNTVALVCLRTWIWGEGTSIQTKIA